MSNITGTDPHQDLQAAQIQSGTHGHAFNVDAISREAVRGFGASADVRDAIQRLVAEFSNRRVGSGIASILISF